MSDFEIVWVKWLKNAMTFAADRAAEEDRTAAKGGGSGAEVALFLLRMSRNKSTSVVFYRNKIIPAESFYSHCTQKRPRIVAAIKNQNKSVLLMLAPLLV